MNQIISAVGGKDRADYLRLLEAVPEVASGFVVQRSHLRLEAALANGRPNYRFELFPNATTARPTEKRLNRNDMFCITRIALGIAKYNPTSGAYGNFPLYFNPDPNYFLGVPGSGLPESECLNAVYNASVALKSGTTERIPPFLANPFRSVPERGYTFAVAPQLRPEHGQMDEIPWFELEPLVILSGQEDNVVSLDLPAASDLGVLQGGINQSNAAVDTRNVAVFLLGGFVVSEGAQVQTRFNTY